MIKLPIETTVYIHDTEQLETMENIEQNLTTAKMLIKVIEGTMNYYSKIARYEQTNLKLYDVSYHTEEMVEKYYPNFTGNADDLFWNFCESEYWSFEEYLNEENLVMNHIGRTSSFYFGLKNDKRADELFEMIEESSKERIKWNDIVQSDYDYLYVLDNINDNTKAKDIVKNYIEEHSNMNDFDLMSVLQNIETGTEEFVDMLTDEKYDLDSFQQDISKIKKAYELLDIYKANQLENFKEYLLFQNEQ